MPAPHAAPSRRGPVARRAPVRAQPRGHSSTPWLVVLGLGTLAGSVAMALWLSKIRATSPRPSPVAVSVPSPGGAEPPELAPAPVTPEQVGQAVAEAPLLTPDAALALLTEDARRGQRSSHALDNALFVASAGLQDLDQPTLHELGAILSKGWSTKSAAAQQRIQAYLQYARAGQPLGPEAIAAGRSLFAESVRALPAASQRRLTELFAKAVTTGIAHRHQAEERTRVAALTPLPPVAPPTLTRVQDAAAGTTSPPLAGTYATDRFSSASTQGDEGHWRSRAASARAAVAAAEKRVHDLDERALREGPAVPGPFAAPCQAGAAPRPLEGAISLRDRSGRTITCDSGATGQQDRRALESQLEAARNALARAQKGLEAFEEEARRAGALPGWLR